MTRRSHSPAYVTPIRKMWRIVVPIRGRLSPRICPQEFDTQLAASAWLESEEGLGAVELERNRGSGASNRSTHTHESAGAQH
jgi:hypothetical protein